MTKLLGWFIAIGLLATLLLSNLAAYVPAGDYWLIALAGLSFPIAFTFNLIGLLFTAFKKHRLFWAFLLLGLSSIPNIAKTVAFNTTKKMDSSQHTERLTVMSWNVGIMNFSAPDSMTAIRENKNIFQTIKNSDADVLCLQEFFSAMSAGSHYNLLDSVARTMNYPYYYFSRDHPYFSGESYSGSVIFSRFPIVDTARFPFSSGSEGAIIKATIQKGKRRINVLSSRFQSVYLNNYDYATLGLKREKKQLFSAVRTISRKLKYGFQQRTQQVRLMDSLVKNSPHALISCIDLNDTPTSYAYQTLQQQLTDVWRANGNGLGRTFKLFSPTLRIDYIFYSAAFESQQVTRIQSTGTDHLALLAQLSIKKGAE